MEHKQNCKLKYDHVCLRSGSLFYQQLLIMHSVVRLLGLSDYEKNLKKQTL
jgi:hypothetical protein